MAQTAVFSRDIVVYSLDNNGFFSLFANSNAIFYLYTSLGVLQCIFTDIYGAVKAAVKVIRNSGSIAVIDRYGSLVHNSTLTKSTQFFFVTYSAFDEERFAHTSLITRAFLYTLLHFYGGSQEFVHNFTICVDIILF